ncbi:MAG: hypothetical protein C4297_13270 [Gemmataceae bacterium]
MLAQLVTVGFLASLWNIGWFYNGSTVSARPGPVVTAPRSISAGANEASQYVALSSVERHGQAERGTDATQRYRVPYELTPVKHVMVRAKINGKGPFHFILDTGAPAVFVGTEAAGKAGLQPDARGWAVCNTLEIEGGILLNKERVLVEDPFQLVGMNRMNLAGVRYHGMLGYTVLARFRIEYDFTQRHLHWTPLSWKPPAPKGLAQLGGKVPPEVSMMSGMATLFSTLLGGRRPETQFLQRPFLGIEYQETEEGLLVRKVVLDSPAYRAGVKVGDSVTAIAGRPVRHARDLAQAYRHYRGGDLEITVRSAAGERTLKIPQEIAF